MGKINHAIEMLNYLNTGNKYKVKELSNKLGISERMVKYYKKELEESGIAIETFMGPGGGYYILNTNNLINEFNKYDIELLENIKEILKKNNYIYLDKYNDLINKIKSNVDINEDKSKYFNIIDIEENSELYFTLNEIINKKGKIKILYRNMSQEWQERTIHPIQIFKYKDVLYVTAFCELRGDIRHFELSRIKINIK